MRNPVLAALLASAFFSIDAGATDLLQIYQDALQNDAQFASARAALSAGQEKIVQGRSGLMPSVSLGGSYSHSSSTSSSDLQAERSSGANTNAYSLSLTQPLFNWGVWQGYEQSKLAVVVSEAQFAAAQLDLITRVAQAYFDVLAAQDTVATLQAQKTAISEQLASAKRNFEVGTSTITDTHEAQARYDLTIAQEFAGQSDLEVKRAALRQIIGREAGELAPLTVGVKLQAPQPQRIDDWVGSAEKQNYGIVAAQVGVEIAKRTISLNRAGHYPVANLVASSGKTRTSDAAFGMNSSARSNSIGVQWSVPLFSGFAVDSKVREAISLEDKARQDFEVARRAAAQGARQAYLGVNSGLAQVKALEAAEVSSQSALDSNKLGYQVGVRINIDVLNAQQQLYTTRQNLAKARYDTIMNGLRLKSAAGSLKDTDLAEINALLAH